jgi:phosphatidylglycerol:prolipoprotein diacylglycerol transferase
MSMPYIDIPSLPIGPLTLQPFGVLVASGVLLGTWMARKYAEQNELDEETLRFLGIRLLIVGFISCHVFNTLFYEWDRLTGTGRFAHAGADWILMLKIYDGISSWGGAVGATACFLYYAHKYKLDRRLWADCLSWGVAGGWLLGRMACAVVHDHTGGPTDFFLGIHVPSPAPEHAPGIVAQYAGQTIHDLGLYEFLYLIPLTVAVVLLARIKSRKPGLLIGFLMLVYSVPRFFLDSLRPELTDPRHLGMTFGQWCCIIGALGGAAILFGPRPAPAEAGAIPASVTGAPQPRSQAAADQSPAKKAPSKGKRKKR